MIENGLSESGVSENSAGLQESNVQQSDRLFTQEEVRKIAGKTKLETEQKAYERARRDLMAEQQAAVYSSQSSRPLTEADMVRIAEDRARAIAKEQAQIAHDEAVRLAMAKQTIASVAGKLNNGYQKFDKYGETVATLKLDQNPLLLKALDAIDNADEVAFEIASNPEKRARLKAMAKEDFDDTVAVIQNISKSIKENQVAKKSTPEAREPLSQIKPSSTGVDSGPMTLSEMKNMSWLRG